jgi:hypothetical protein
MAARGNPVSRNRFVLSPNAPDLGLFPRRHSRSAGQARRGREPLDPGAGRDRPRSQAGGRPVPVHDAGLLVGHLFDTEAAVYVTPAHQFPPNRVLGAERRRGAGVLASQRRERSSRTTTTPTNSRRRSVSAVVAPAEIGNAFADLQFDRHRRRRRHQRPGARSPRALRRLRTARPALPAGCHGCANNSQPLMSDKLIATIKAATMESSTRHAAGRASTGASR